MFLSLLLLFAAARVAQQAGLQPCPAHTACLYHFHCVRLSSNADESGDIVVATMDESEFDAFEKKTCKGEIALPTTLSVRPISTNKWSFTLMGGTSHVGLKFGDALTVLANETEATFKSGSDKPTKITVLRTETGDLQFTVDVPEKLMETFNGSSIFYLNDAKQISKENYSEPLFWQQIQKLTPCNDSLIIDDCAADAKKCSHLLNSGYYAGCTKEGHQFWMNSKDSTWVHLKDVRCNEETNEWNIHFKTTEEIEELSGAMKFRCAPLMPVMCNVSLINDNCTPDRKNCAVLEKTEELVKCPPGNKIWWKSADSQWLSLRDLTCNKSTNEWTKTFANGTISVEPNGKNVIRCATVEPASCDVSRIVDDCTPGKSNCEKLQKTEEYVKCRTGKKMWWKSKDSKFQMLQDVTCDRSTKQWKKQSANGPELFEVREVIAIRCAEHEPESATETKKESKPSHANDILRLFMFPIVLYFVRA